MLHTTVNSKTIMTFSILVIVLVSLFASCSILTNQQAGGRGGAAGDSFASAGRSEGGHAGFVGSSSGIEGGHVTGGSFVGHTGEGRGGNFVDHVGGGGLAGHLGHFSFGGYGGYGCYHHHHHHRSYTCY